MSSGQYQLDFTPRPQAEARPLKAAGFELCEPRRCPCCDAVSFKPAGSDCWICRRFPGLRRKAGA